MSVYSSSGQTGAKVGILIDFPLKSECPRYLNVNAFDAIIRVFKSQFISPF